MLSLNEFLNSHGFNSFKMENTFLPDVIIALTSGAIGGFFSLYVYRISIKAKQHKEKLKEIEINYKKESYFKSNVT